MLYQYSHKQGYIFKLHKSYTALIYAWNFSLKINVFSKDTRHKKSDFSFFVISLFFLKTTHLWHVSFKKKKNNGIFQCRSLIRSIYQLDGLLFQNYFSLKNVKQKHDKIRNNGILYCDILWIKKSPYCECGKSQQIYQCYLI